MQSDAAVRGYGGAMGGGKSRTICEVVFDWAIDYPGIIVPIARQQHVSITNTTKATMLNQVVPTELQAHPEFRKKISDGQDWIRLPNRSEIHFIGLEDPIRWFSSELGCIAFDEAHEITEDTVVKLATRLRQRGMPHKALLSFNPADPGHWLKRWFIDGATRTRYGYRKPDLYATDGDQPIGDAEFIFANAAQNPYLPPGYVDKTLAGLPRALRRRYLEGRWEFITGDCYFDLDALTWYGDRIEPPAAVGRTAGDVTGTDRRDRVRVRPDKHGPLRVFRPPVREREHPDTGEILPAHRYVVAVDVSSGGSTDYSAIQVVDIDDLEQAAEWQAKLDPDLVAVEAFRLAVIYNGALVAPETTGGYGHTVVRAVERLLAGYKPTRSKPRLYTRRIEDRLTKQYTDRLGWDTTVKTRAVMLDTLEQLLREREFWLRGERTLGELATFVRDELDRPAAQPGCNDDLVIALAIGVTVATGLPREVRRERPRRHTAQFAATGY